MSRKSALDSRTRWAESRGRGKTELNAERRGEIDRGEGIHASDSKARVEEGFTITGPGVWPLGGGRIKARDTPRGDIVVKAAGGCRALLNGMKIANAPKRSSKGQFAFWRKTWRAARSRVQ